MPLSPPSSRYGVSTLELEIPLPSPLLIDDPNAKSGGKSILETDTVLCTLFYPTEKPGKGVKLGSGLSWLNAPRLKTLEGLLKYAGLSKYLAVPAILPTYAAFSAKLPYVQNAPLAKPSSSSSEEQGKSATPRGPDVFPAAVFSHGLAGGRTMYSQYLSSLASEGMVIAAIDHRDCSALATTLNHPPSSSSSAKAPTSETRLYARPDEIDGLTAESPDKDKIPFRAAQLKLRTQEVGLIWDVVAQLAKGEGEEVWKRNLRKGGAKDENLKLGEWKGRLNVETPIMLGHSFGGATSIEVLRDPKTPFAYGLVLDPWMEPIAKANDPTASPLERPLYVINSDAFTIWRSHYADVRSAVSQARAKSGRGWLMTLTGSKHTDFSDFPVLLPRFLSSSVPAADAIRFFASATWSQVLSSLSSSSPSSGAEADRQSVLAPLLSPLGSGTSSYPYAARSEREGEVESRDLGQAGNVIVHKLDGAEVEDWEWIKGREGRAKVDGEAEVKTNGHPHL